MTHEYTFQKVSFAPRTYLVWRRTIRISDVADRDMWQAAFGKVHGYIQSHGIAYAGPGSALYFRWDEESGLAEIGIGNPVEGASDVLDPDLSLVHVPESKATRLVVRGDYGRLREAHAAMAAHLHDEPEATPGLAIEEYVVTGMDRPDSEDWETHIFYLQD